MDVWDLGSEKKQHWRCSNPIAVRCCPHIALELCGWIRVGVELVMLLAIAPLALGAAGVTRVQAWKSMDQNDAW